MTETDEGYANKQIQVITILPMLVTLIKIQTSFVLLCSCLTLFKCTNLRVNIQRQFYRHLFLMFNLFFLFWFLSVLKVMSTCIICLEEGWNLPKLPFFGQTCHKKCMNNGKGPSLKRRKGVLIVGHPL